MKALTHILIFFGLLGCGQGERKTIVQTSNQDSKLIEKERIQDNTEDSVPTLQLPDGFRLDTIQKTDSERNLLIFISIPVSGIKQIDKVVFEEIEKQKNDFIQSLDEMIKENSRILNTVSSYFQAEPISVYKDDKVTSILFIVSYYPAGAAHGMLMYYSFNFDNITQQRILFSDYFVLKNKADTVFMTDRITKSIKREGIFITELNNLDFNIEKDAISFNFDNYEIASYAEGILRGRIQKFKLYNKVKTTYR
jgi:hypothetical protein